MYHLVSNCIFVLATWLVKKYILVQWRKSRPGLYFSVIDRTCLVDQRLLETGDDRVIQYYGETIKIKVLYIDTLERCLNAFDKYAHLLSKVPWYKKI